MTETSEAASELGAAYVSLGHHPWSPAGAENLDVWHAYDLPVLGTFTVAGRSVLFLAFAETDYRAWVLLELTAGETLELGDVIFDTYAAMWQRVEQLDDGREMTVVGVDDALTVQSQHRVADEHR